MLRIESASSVSSLWIPAVAIMGIAILAASSACIADAMYWTLTSIPIVVLASWKLLVRRQATQSPVPDLTPEQIAKLRPYGYLFLSVYFLSTSAFLGYSAAVWYYRLELSWTFFITFLAIFAIKIDVWSIVVRHAISKLNASSAP